MSEKQREVDVIAPIVSTLRHVCFLVHYCVCRPEKELFL